MSDIISNPISDNSAASEDPKCYNCGQRIEAPACPDCHGALKLSGCSNVHCVYRTPGDQKLDGEHWYCPTCEDWMGAGCFAAENLSANDLLTILKELIAELRDRHPAGEYCCCGQCERDFVTANRLEQKLKGLLDDE